MSGHEGERHESECRISKRRALVDMEKSHHGTSLEVRRITPLLLSQVTKLDLLKASDSELSRVMWFWLRRPKLMFHDSAALMKVALCIPISLSIALVNWPGTSMAKRVAELIILLFEVAVEMYLIGHRLKFLRWRREYERSIDRLIRTLRPGV
jgi:hypothetical protein